MHTTMLLITKKTDFSKNNSLASYTLQKQVGYFNQRVATLVADKLERQ